jgi:hypothetical protein
LAGRRRARDGGEEFGGRQGPAAQVDGSQHPSTLARGGVKAVRAPLRDGVEDGRLDGSALRRAQDRPAGRPQPRVTLDTSWR